MFRDGADQVARGGIKGPTVLLKHHNSDGRLCRFAFWRSSRERNDGQSQGWGYVEVGGEGIADLGRHFERFSVIGSPAVPKRLAGGHHGLA